MKEPRLDKDRKIARPDGFGSRVAVGLSAAGLELLVAMTAAQAQSAALPEGYRQIIAKAHAKGIRFLCSTLTPYEGSSGWRPAGESARKEVNAFLFSSESGCDAIVDQDAATHDPVHPTRFLPAYDAGDHLHPNDAGFETIAGAVSLKDFSYRRKSARKK
jgi:hypothetical protein